ncbi:MULTISPECIES: heavy-metal-associated domain-containing protein [unclassified Microbacterium]|uniref:heavy-metal-associated domain-containing protein n=1 Tax=Microbacterium TaxID=33882 RepID=UPI003BA35A99
MNAGARLALYGAGLVAAFGAAFGVAAAVAPDAVVTAWNEEDKVDGHGGGHTTAPTDGTASDGAQSESAHGAPGDGAHGAHAPQGVTLSADGYTLTAVAAPSGAGEQGELSFQILDSAGEPLTSYAIEHEKELHLIVVRSDGAHFRHVHPELDAHTGAWSIPWSWEAAGTYRVYADFTPAGDGAQGLTLARSVEVAGDYTPVSAEPSRVDEVGGYTVELAGDLAPGAAQELTLSITRDGEPVTALEPYLGAFGHLVALRQGDLAYLHVHPEGAEPGADDLGGPEIAFAAEAPTAGRYLLYLDFQVDGQVHTAEFVLDAGEAAPGHGHAHSGGH